MGAKSFLFTLLASLVLLDEVLASCGWYLNPNECICMNSADGRVMVDETALCCQEMGLKAANNKCTLDEDTRQTYKNCCKWLRETSVIGHCH